MEAMADRLGNPVSLGGETRHTFPSANQLQRAGESVLRELGLGFRAPYVIAAANMVATGALDLDELKQATYVETKNRLMDCPGIGAKIADCIAVFALENLEAFPVDVWVSARWLSGTSRCKKAVRPGYGGMGPGILRPIRRLLSTVPVPRA